MKEEHLLLAFMLFIFIFLMTIVYSTDVTTVSVIQDCKNHGLVIFDEVAIDCKVRGS